MHVAWSILRCYRMANRLRLERRGLISAVCDVVSDESVDKLILFWLLQGGQKVMIQYCGWKMILVFVWLVLSDV